MKFLKKYELFESNIIDVLTTTKDIFLDLQDDGFILEYSTFNNVLASGKIQVVIFGEGGGYYGVKWIKVKNSVNRMVGYLNSIGYKSSFNMGGGYISDDELIKVQDDADFNYIKINIFK